MLELTFTLNLEQYGNCSVLLLCGHIREVVLGVSQLFGTECDVNVQRTGLCIELSKRSSTNIEGLEVPANAALNTLVGEQQILDNIVVILNATLRLCKARQVAATVAGYKLNLTASFLLKHFSIALCLSNSINVIQRHRTKSAKGFFFFVVGFVGCGSGLFFNSFFGNFFNNFFSNGFFILNQSNCIGCICRLIKSFRHSVFNSLLNFFGYVSTAICFNLVCKLECDLVCHIGNSFITVINCDFGNLSIEIFHSLCNSIGCICIKFCFFSFNTFSKSVSQSIQVFINCRIGIFDKIGSNNGFNLGNITLCLNRDNSASAGLFNLDELKTNKDRDNNKNNECDKYDQRNTDCGAPERNVEIGSHQEGDLTCGSVSLNNVVGFVCAQANCVGILCSCLSAGTGIIDVKVVDGERQAILICNKVSSYGNADAELIACGSTGDGERVALVLLQAANSLFSKLSGNAQSCLYGIRDTILTKDNDCTVGSRNENVVTNNVHSCFESSYFIAVYGKAIIAAGQRCFYSVGTGLCNSSSTVIVCIRDSRKKFCRKFYTVCTFNDQLIDGRSNCIAIVDELAVVKYNLVHLLCDGNALGIVNVLTHSIEICNSTWNNCGQRMGACINDVCEIYNNQLNSSTVVVTDCLDAKPSIITIGEGAEALPCDGGNFNRGYVYHNLKGLCNTVVHVVACQDYINVSNNFTNTVCYKGDLVLGICIDRNVEAILLQLAIVGSRDHNVLILSVYSIGIVGYGSSSVIAISPGKACRLNLCGYRVCLIVSVGNGNGGFAYVNTVKLGSCRELLAAYFNRDGCVNVVGSVVSFYPTAVFKIEVGGSGKSNGLYLFCCVDREDHAANHNRKHCYESHDSDEIALACKLNLLMFHNITTFP